MARCSFGKVNPTRGTSAPVQRLLCHWATRAANRALLRAHSPAIPSSGLSDEIYLVEPHRGELMWWIWPVKRDEAHWPAVGMPENGRPYYSLGQSPAEGFTQ